MIQPQQALAVIHRLTTALADHLQHDAALQYIVTAAREIFGCEAVGIWRVAHSGTLHPAAETPAGSLPKQVTSLAHIQQAGVISAGDPYAVALATPILWHGVRHGVLVAFDSDPDCFAAQVQALAWAGLLAQQAALHTAYYEDQEQLLHIQRAMRRMLEQPDIHANLGEVTQALQALGWGKVILALFSMTGDVERLLTAGIADEERTALETEVVPQPVWDRFLAGELEAKRMSGLYFVPTDAEGSVWQAGDVLFAPLRMGTAEVSGVICLCEPGDGVRPTAETLHASDILAAQAAYIIENGRLLEETSRIAETLADQVDELSMMHRADRELSSHLRVDRVIKLTMDWALRRTGADTGLLSLMTEDKHGLVPFVMMGYLDRDKLDYTEDRPMPLDLNVIGRAASTNRTEIVTDPQDEQISFMPYARSHVSVPLSMRGEVLGVLSLASTNTEVFDEIDVTFLERLARRAAVALDNARLFRQSEQLADDMAVLYSASRTITSTLERGEMLQRVAQSLATALECSSAFILDYRAESEEVQVLAVYKLATALDAHEVLPTAEQVIRLNNFSAMRRVVESRRAVVLSLVDEDISEVDRASLEENRVQALMLLPLMAQDELIGLAVVLEGRRPRRISFSEVFKAETLASQASVALRQSMLFEEVLELEKLKSEMIRMASHDLRNPLNNMMGYIELLAISLNQFGITPDQEGYLASLRRGATTMKTLIDDLLTLERIESDRKEDWQNFDLSGLIYEVIEAAQSSAYLKSQRLSLERESNTPTVFGSVTQIRQAAANLVDNAIKYTPDDGQIEVRFWREGNHLHFEVEDNGYGISMERQVRLFQRFYRAREPGTDHIGGTGLGLSLVKTVIERHGGQIKFWSEKGVGSMFGFWMPITETNA